MAILIPWIHIDLCEAMLNHAIFLKEYFYFFIQFLLLKKLAGFTWTTLLDKLKVVQVFFKSKSNLS